MTGRLANLAIECGRVAPFRTVLDFMKIVPSTDTDAQMPRPGQRRAYGAASDPINGELGASTKVSAIAPTSRPLGVQPRC